LVFQRRIKLKMNERTFDLFSVDLKAYIASKNIPLNDLFLILNEDKLDEIKELYNGIPHSTDKAVFYATAMALRANKIVEWINAKTIFIKEPEKHLVRLEIIIMDYIKEFIGTNDGFDGQGIVDASYSDLQEMMLNLQALEAGKDTYSDDETLIDFWMYLRPLLAFSRKVEARSEKETSFFSREEDKKLNYKYYDRVRMEVLGLTALGGKN